MPVYLLVVVLLLFGVLAGLGVGWWAGRHHRRRAREAGSEAARLEREVGTPAQQALAAQQPVPTPAGPALREQKAIERQSALVAADLGSPGDARPVLVNTLP